MSKTQGGRTTWVSHDAIRNLKYIAEHRKTPVAKVIASLADNEVVRLQECVFWPFRSLILVLSDHLTIPAR